MRRNYDGKYDVIPVASAELEFNNLTLFGRLVDLVVVVRERRRKYARKQIMWYIDNHFGDKT